MSARPPWPFTTPMPKALPSCATVGDLLEALAKLPRGMVLSDSVTPEVVIMNNERYELDLSDDGNDW